MYSSRFLSLKNFDLAFTRVTLASNKDYKRFYRHLIPSYQLTSEENLRSLIARIKSNPGYAPDKPRMVYLPKASGILRPQCLLSLDDLILYQAIVNEIARSFASTQQRFAGKKTFGAVYAGDSSRFFYRSWRRSYKQFTATAKAAFKSGNNYLADFDLVSFYELVDHGLLRSILSKSVKDKEMLDLLFRCLKTWTTNPSGSLEHGIPQGPEPSAFLAECLMFSVDRRSFKGTVYLRYIDDIKLLGKSETPLRRALMRLDLASKRLGLVPQAQKIGPPRRIGRASEIYKSIPSLAPAGANSKAPKQGELLKVLRRSLRKDGRRWLIKDATKFKFALGRLNPRRDVLRRIARFLVERPDLSFHLSSYFRKFPDDQEAADLLHTSLKQNPVYDAAAGNYIEAMDVCEPSRRFAQYRQTIKNIFKCSIEKSLTLRLASATFFGRRFDVRKAISLISNEDDALVRGNLLHRLFGDLPNATFQTNQAASLFDRFSREYDRDLARYSASMMLSRINTQWKAKPPVNPAVADLFFGLGLGAKPKRPGILDSYFQLRLKIGIPILWKKALKGDLKDAESRCLRLQKLAHSDPTARILMLDTFNEVLIQNFSCQHPALLAQYKSAAGKKAHPDFGNWLGQPFLAAILPLAQPWFLRVHNERVKSDLAHAKQKNPKGGQPWTKAIKPAEADKLVAGSQRAFVELLKAWQTLQKSAPVNSKRAVAGVP